MVRAGRRSEGRGHLCARLPGACRRHLLVDGGKLRQVLAQPAVERRQVHRRPASVTLVPGAQTGSASDGVRLQFAVRDSGIGIAPDDQARIFEPFVQAAHANRARPAPGSGLTISRAVRVSCWAAAMQLRLDAGQRALTFSFAIPAQVDRNAPPPPPALRGRPTPCPPLQRPRRRWPKLGSAAIMHGARRANGAGRAARGAPGARRQPRRRTMLDRAASGEHGIAGRRHRGDARVRHQYRQLCAMLDQAAAEGVA
jgi:hypothetical protein